MERQYFTHLIQAILCLSPHQQHTPPLSPKARCRVYAGVLLLCADMLRYMMLLCDRACARQACEEPTSGSTTASGSCAGPGQEQCSTSSTTSTASPEAQQQYLQRCLDRLAAQVAEPLSVPHFKAMLQHVEQRLVAPEPDHTSCSGDLQALELLMQGFWALGQAGSAAAEPGSTPAPPAAPATDATAGQRSSSNPGTAASPSRPAPAELASSSAPCTQATAAAGARSARAQVEYRLASQLLLESPKLSCKLLALSAPCYEPAADAEAYTAGLRLIKLALAGVGQQAARRGLWCQGRWHVRGLLGEPENMTKACWVSGRLCGLLGWVEPSCVACQRGLLGASGIRHTGCSAGCMASWVNTLLVWPAGCSAGQEPACLTWCSYLSVICNHDAACSTCVLRCCPATHCCTDLHQVSH